MKTQTRKRKPNQKVSKGLKGFADTRKSPVDIIRDIQLHVTAEGAKNANTGREDHKIHVSEIVKDHACPRQMFYKVSKAERTDSVPGVGARMETIWAAGNAEHAKWQKWLQEMGELWGDWKCQACGRQESATTQPGHCGECGMDVWLYDEVHLEDQDFPVVGHADAGVPRLDCLVEIKSFSVGTVRMENPKLVRDHTYKVDGKSLVDHEGLWNAVKRPLTTHLKQGLFYLWLCKRMGLPFDRIVFIYENKTTQATKAFEVKYSERMIREHLDMLDDVMIFAAEGVLPARPALFDKGSKPCNACPFRTGCWEWDDNDREETAEVPAGRQSPGGGETGGEAEVRPARAARDRDPDRPRRRNRSERPRPARADDGTDEVGRASRRATRDGRGRRTLGRSRDGEGEGPGASNQGQGRDRA